MPSLSFSPIGAHASTPHAPGVHAPKGLVPPTSQAPASAPGLSFRWHRAIEEIEADWDLCLGTADVLRSYALHLAVERSQLSDVDLHYLVGTRDGRTACVIPCYVGRASFLTLASPLLQRLVDGVRRVFPGFLWVKLFVVGSPVSTSGDLLGFRDTFDDALWTHAAVTAVMDEVLRKAAETRTLLTVVKEMESSTTDFLRSRLLRPFLFVESLPTTYLDVPPKALGGYYQAICSKYRNKLKKRKAVTTSRGITWVRTPDCRGREDEVFRLYNQVLQHSDFVFERLNQAFFSRVCETLGDKAYYVMGFQNGASGSKLVSFELMMHDKARLHPFISGFDYSVKQDSDLYFSSFYTMIEEAEEQGLTEVHLGQTAYEVKAELGATCSKLYIAVYHRWAWVRWVLFKLRGLLTTEVVFPERQVFRNAPTPPKSRRSDDNTPLAELAG